MKKSYKKLLQSLIVAPPHRFKYKTFVLDENTGGVTYSNWIDAWTDGVRVFESAKEWVPLSQMKNVTTQSLKAMCNALLREKNSPHTFYTYSWEYSSDKVKLDRNHPWLKEMENDV